MAFDAALIGRTRWEARPRELGELRDARDGAHVEMVLRWPGLVDDWAAVCKRWASLPAHPHVLRLTSYSGEEAWLRYAALDWSAERGPRTAEAVATCGVRLTRVFELIHATLDERAWLARPVVYFDLIGQPRVAFAPALGHREALPPEVVKDWPACSEPGWVFVIGGVLAKLGCATDGRLVKVIDRCLRTEPRKRFASLRELRVALVLAGGSDAPCDDDATWHELEAGLGWMELGELVVARGPLGVAARTRWAPMAQEALRRIDVALAQSIEAGLDEAARRRARAEARRAEEARWHREGGILGEARRCEAGRDFERALGGYARLPETSALGLAGQARCHLALGSIGPALQYAAAAVTADPASVEALMVAVDANLTARRLPDALACADALIAAAPDDGVAHYKRGRCQLALGQPANAYASFDRACTLAPELLEAMYLRREADRGQRGVRDTVGEQPALGLDLPPHLSPIRDALLAGRAIDALAMLARPAYDDDAIAQLLRASVLLAQARPGEALALYERPGPLFDDHREALLLGKARALIALDDPEAALRLLDHACAEHPASRATAEARADLLLSLGRPTAAEADLRRAANP